MHAPNTRIQNFRTTVAILALAIGGALFFAPHAEFVDEHQHLGKVRRHLALQLDPGAIAADPDSHATTMFYYYALAAAAKAAGATDLAGFRFLTLLLGLGSAWVFHRIASLTRPEAGNAAVLQYWLLPFLFPYFYMAYTDVPMLLFVLLALWAALAGGTHRAAAALLCAAAVRPHAAAWAPFLCLAAYHARAAAGKAGSVAAHLARSWALFAVPALLAAFAVWNRGVAMTDREMNPFGFFTANLWYAPFVFFVSFLPLHLANLPRIRALVMKRPAVSACAIAAVFALYMFDFKNTHPYNQADRLFFMRNWILHGVFSSAAAKALFFVPVAWAALSLAVTRLKRPEFYWIYPFAALSLVPSWMVEHRYAFVPLVFFMLFRETYSKKIETATVLYYAAVSAVLAYKLNYHVFFL